MAEPGVPERLVVWSDSEGDSEGEKLAAKLGVDLYRQEDPPAGANLKWMLFFDEDVLFLHSFEHEEFKPLFIDYLSPEFRRRWRTASRNDLLLKALGSKKGTRSVCDATCGLGYDAFFLTVAGKLDVTSCERNPVVAELVMNALLRVRDAGVFEELPLFLFLGDAIPFLRSHPREFDAVYLDPMYPRDEDKSAKQKKEMQLFRELVGKDLDAGELFEAAWASAVKRVVVKRPDDAAALAVGREPDIVFPGTTVRFDVYLKA